MHSGIAVPVSDIVYFFFCFPMLEPSLFGGKSGDDIFKVCTLHRLHLESTKVLIGKNKNVNGGSHLKKVLFSNVNFKPLSCILEFNHGCYTVPLLLV